MKIKIFLEEGWEIKLLGEKNEIQLKMKKMYFAAWVEQKVELKLLLPVTPEAREDRVTLTIAEMPRPPGTSHR